MAVRDWVAVVWAELRMFRNVQVYERGEGVKYLVGHSSFRITPTYPFSGRMTVAATSDRPNAKTNNEEQDRTVDVSTDISAQIT